MGLNSVSLPFTAAGAAYTLTVNATIPTGSLGDACAIAVFQDASFNELARTSIQIVPQPMTLRSAQTDANGAFAFTLTPQPAPLELWADFAGADTLWPAASAVAINAAPALTITTNTLPDATAGIAYSQQLRAVGGRSPYLWAGGATPPGLVLGQDGTLTGTPTQAGIYTILVSAVDDSSATQVADASLQLAVH